MYALLVSPYDVTLPCIQCVHVCANQVNVPENSNAQPCEFVHMNFVYCDIQIIHSMLVHILQLALCFACTVLQEMHRFCEQRVKIQEKKIQYKNGLKFSLNSWNYVMPSDVEKKIVIPFVSVLNCFVMYFFFAQSYVQDNQYIVLLKKWFIRGLLLKA